MEGIKVEKGYLIGDFDENGGYGGFGGFFSTLMGTPKKLFTLKQF
jgi:hypothetical protein